MRSKSQWYEEVEKSTKCFLSLEKKNKVKSHIRKMCLNRDEEDTADPQKMLDKFLIQVYTRKGLQKLNRHACNTLQIEILLTYQKKSKKSVKAS